MLDEKRFGLIFRQLVIQKMVKTKDVMELCGVSHETARKDLERMQEMGICKRVHGGAVLLQTEDVSIWKSRYLTEEKSEATSMEAIAKKAASLIMPGSRIYLDTGNTMAHVSQHIKNIQDLTVITPNPVSIVELAGTKVNLVFLGGEMSRKRPGFIVKQPENLKEYEPEMAFISCAGMDLHNGVLMEYDNYGFSRQELRDFSQKVVLVLNSEKINRKALINACPLTYVDIVVVDDGIKKQDKELLSGYGIKVVVA